LTREIVKREAGDLNRSIEKPELLVVNQEIISEVYLKVFSDIKYLDVVQSISDSFSHLAGFEGEDIYWVGLSIREAVTNAILHGNKNDAKIPVLLSFRQSRDRLVVTVTDQGEGMDESKLPDPRDPENLLKPGGRGIFLVKSFMDNVFLNTPAGGGTELVMEKYIKEGEKNED
jgi:serine/threonine-protein kinase RsbW